MIQPQRQKIRTNKFQCNDHNVFWWVDIHQRLKNKQKKDHCLRPLPHWLWSYPLIQFNFTENTRISEMMVWDALDGDLTRDLGSRVLSTDPSLAGRDLPPSSRINNFVLLLQDKGSGEVNQEQSVEWGRYHLWVLASNFCHTLFASEANDEGM